MKKTLISLFGAVVFYFLAALILFAAQLLGRATFGQYTIWILAGCMTYIALMLLIAVALGGKKKSPPQPQEAEPAESAPVQ